MIKLDPDDQDSDVEMKLPVNRVPVTMNSMEANSSSMANNINSTNHVQNSTQVNNVNVNLPVQPVVPLSNFVSKK